MDTPLDPSISEVDGGPVTLGPSLFFHLEKALKSYPDRTAVVVAHQDANHLMELADQSHSSNAQKDPTSNTTNNSQSTADCLQWSFKSLHNAALHVVAALDSCGVQAGARIAHLIPNCIEWSVLSWSCMLGKLTQAALDPGMLSLARATELQNILDTLRPDVIVVPDEEGAAAVDSALTILGLAQPRVKLVLASHRGIKSTTGNPDGHSFSTESTSTGKKSSWTSLVSFALSASPLDPVTRSTLESAAHHDDLARYSLILFTSGTTTGVPKGCPRSVASVLFLLAGQSWGSLCLGPSNAMFHASQVSQISNDADVPCHAMTSQNFRIIAPALALSTWSAGGTVVMPSVRPDPGALLKAIAKFAITMVLFIPASLHTTLAHPDFGTTDKSSIKTVIVGGDMVTRDHWLKAAHAFPAAEVMAGHGMTEGGGAFYIPYLGRTGMSIVESGDKTIIPFHNSLCPLGKVNAGTRLRLASADGTSNQPVKRGELGELHFCSPSFIRSYMKNVHPETFYQEVDEAGKTRHWFKSGDLGMVDEDGWVWILGRKKDVIKRAGIPVVPAALESCLNEFLNGQSAILGLPHPTLGQEPFAVVSSLESSSRDRTYTKDDLRQRIIDVFGAEYGLGGVATLPELGLSQFPVNATGKIPKRELEAPVAAWIISNADSQKKL